MFVRFLSPLVLENADIVEDLDLTFELSLDKFGQREAYQLIPGGKKEKNKHRYKHKHT